MFPQQYGTCYYGKRLPVQGTEQLAAVVEGYTEVSYTRVFLLHLKATAESLAFYGPRVINKTCPAVVHGLVDLRKHLSVLASSTVDAITTSTKTISLIPITITNEGIGYVRKRMQQIVLTASSILTWLTKRKVYEFEFFGDFEPDDILQIDSKTFRVTLNGTNVLYLVGRDDFPTILPGENELIYMDEKTGRIVKVRVIWKDRWL